MALAEAVAVAADEVPVRTEADALPGLRDQVAVRVEQKRAGVNGAAAVEAASAAARRWRAAETDRAAAAEGRRADVAEVRRGRDCRRCRRSAGRIGVDDRGSVVLPNSRGRPEA